MSISGKRPAPGPADCWHLTAEAQHTTSGGQIVTVDSGQWTLDSDCGLWTVGTKLSVMWHHGGVQTRGSAQTHPVQYRLELLQVNQKTGPLKMVWVVSLLWIWIHSPLPLCCQEGLEQAGSAWSQHLRDLLPHLPRPHQAAQGCQGEAPAVDRPAGQNLF